MIVDLSKIPEGKKWATPDDYSKCYADLIVFGTCAVHEENGILTHVPLDQLSQEALDNAIREFNK